MSLTEAAVSGQGEGTFGPCPFFSELGRVAQVPVVFVGVGRDDKGQNSTAEAFSRLTSDLGRGCRRGARVPRGGAWVKG